MPEEKTVEKDIIDLAYEIKKIIGIKPFDGKTRFNKGKINLVLETSCLDKVVKHLENYFGKPSYERTFCDEKYIIYSRELENKFLQVAGLILPEKGRYTLILAERVEQNLSENGEKSLNRIENLNAQLI